MASRRGLKIRNNDINGGLTGKMLSGTRVGSYRAGRKYSTARIFVKPANPNTPEQQVTRNAFTSSSKAWSATLDDAERALWNSSKDGYKLNNPFGTNFRTGKNVFTGANVTLAQAGMTPATSPSIIFGSDVVIDTVTATATTFDVTSTSFSVGASGEQIIVRATKQLSSGSTTGKVTKIGTIPAVAFTGGLTQSIFANYTTKFGAISAGEKIKVELILVNVGGNATLLNSTLVTVA